MKPEVNDRFLMLGEGRKTFASLNIYERQHMQFESLLCLLRFIDSPNPANLHNYNILSVAQELLTVGLAQSHAL